MKLVHSQELPEKKPRLSAETWSRISTTFAVIGSVILWALLFYGIVH